MTKYYRFVLILDTNIKFSSMIVIMVKYQSNWVSDYVMLVKELKSLDLGWGCSLELGITAVDEIKTPRDQSNCINSVRTINESLQNILYHFSVPFDTCRGPTSEHEQQIYSSLLV